MGSLANDEDRAARLARKKGKKMAKVKKAKRDKTADVVEKLRGHLVIDKHSLDEEIVQQPSKFFEISEAAVAASAHRDYCKEEISRVDADLAAKHRRQIEKSGSRATDAAVSSAVAADTKHQAAVDAHIAAKNNADLLQALKESFHQRSYMLRDLASLHIANYYESSSVNAETGAVKEVKSRRTMDRMAAAREQAGSLNSRRSNKKRD